MTSSGSRSLLTDSATYLVANVVNAAIPFALIPILTRYLMPEEYGQVAMFQVLVSALAAFVGLNAVGAANRKVFDEGVSDESIAHFVAACLQILAATMVVVSLAFLVFGELLGNSLGFPSSWLQLSVLASAASFILSLRLGQWQVRKQARAFGTMQVALGALNAGLSILLVVVLLQGAWGRIIAQTTSVSIFALLALFLLMRDGLMTMSWRPGYIKEALSFGVPLIPHIAGIFLLSTVDRLVITNKLGLSETGVYMVAVQLTMAMAIVFDALNKAFVPWLFERLKRDQEDEKRVVVKLTYLWFVITLAMAGTAFIFGDIVVKLVAGEQYSRAGEVVGWLALGQAFGGMYLMVTNYAFYARKTGRLSVVTIACGALNVLLLLLLIEKYGVHGAAFAFAASMFIRFMLTWLVAQLSHPMPWRLVRRS